MPKSSILSGLNRKKDKAIHTIKLKKPAPTGLTIRTKDTTIKGSVFNKSNKPRSARSISRKAKANKKSKDMTPKGLRLFN